MAYQTQHRLFSYGTLRDPEIQRRMFGTELRQSPVRLQGFAVYECQNDGYYFIKEEEGSYIDGHVVELNDEQLWICDQWEEVPLYTQEQISVQTPNGAISTIVYKKTNPKGNVRVNLEEKVSFSANDYEDELKEVEKFRRNIEQMPEFQEIHRKQMESDRQYFSPQGKERLSFHDAYQEAHDIRDNVKNIGKNELYEGVDGNVIGIPSKGHLYLDTKKRIATFVTENDNVIPVPYRKAFQGSLSMMKEGNSPQKVGYNPHEVSSGSHTKCAICNRPLKSPLAQHRGVGSSCAKKI